MKMLVIPEDFTRDQYVLKPILQAMMTAIGKPRARVEICRDPRFQGIAQVLDWGRLRPVIERYKGMVDLFVVCVDRDGNATRRAALDDLEKRASDAFPDIVMLAEHAWQEVEVWALAGHNDLPKDWDWRGIRQEPNPKEVFFRPFAELKGVAAQPAEGRKTLAETSARNYGRVRRLCDEDVRNLEDRIRALFPSE